MDRFKHKEDRMIRLGPTLFNMRNVRAHDIFFSRLKLLVITAKAYLENHEFSTWGLRSTLRNTNYLSGFMNNWNEHLTNFTTDQSLPQQIHVNHIFYQRVKLLSIMVKSFAEGNPMGTHRRLALKNNVEYICDVLNHMHCVRRPHLQVVK